MHAARHPTATRRRAEIVGAATNLGGIGAGPLIGGVLAQWVTKPLTVPYLVFLGLMAAGAVALALTPETHTVKPADRPAYRPQQIKAPAQARSAFYGALVAAFIAFAALAFFMSPSPNVPRRAAASPVARLGGRDGVPCLRGGGGGTGPAQPLRARGAWGLRRAVDHDGSAAIVVAVQLGTPSLWLFLAGEAVLGAGGGAYFKSSLSTVIALSNPSSRAGTLASFFLAGYAGLSIPAVGLGVLAQDVAPKTALLIFGGLLVAGVAASAGFLLRRPGAPPSPPQPVAERTGGSAPARV